MPISVGVKFCGNCNPYIPAKDILEEIKIAVYNKGLGLEFVSWGFPGMQKLLVISACPVDCTTRPAGNVPKVVIAGETVNNRACKLEQIPSKVVAALIKPG